MRLIHPGEELKRIKKALNKSTNPKSEARNSKIRQNAREFSQHAHDLPPLVPNLPIGNAIVPSNSVAPAPKPVELLIPPTLSA